MTARRAARVLVVDDDPGLRESLRLLGVGSGARRRKWLRSGDYSIHYVKAQLDARRLAAVFDGVADIVGPYLFDPGPIAPRRRPGVFGGRDDEVEAGGEGVAVVVVVFVFGHDVRAAGRLRQRHAMKKCKSRCQ